MPHLLLVRHGKSEWNKLGLWTGHTDVDLATEGREEARAAAAALQDFFIHEAHVSALKRAQQTLHEIQTTLGLENLSIKTHAALNERHYGIHTGKNKWQVKEEVGEELFTKIRRGWDHPIPEGETLKEVHQRVVQYYNDCIVPSLQAEKNILIVAHGNSLRALMKHIENISDEAIADVELQTAEACCYLLSNDGTFVSKEMRGGNNV
ncbi:2,3-bisphosphoglycerate-dependent phosphoglycerate mutase [Patescibacteria group bacterium]|nr:2,3-bisphosphoglycerate-dependent phosphoglycerate mutase [Patescibacteria group bacterium]